MPEKEYLLGNRAKELLIYTTKVTRPATGDKQPGFPKSVTFSYVKDLRETALSIVKNVHAANECLFTTEYKRRLELIKAVLDDCNLMLQLIEICLELGYIDLARCKHWTSLVTNVKYMSASWKKKDGERARKLIEEENARKLNQQRVLIKEVLEGLLRQ